ncbi:MAG: efflux RND transporter periplasmic adaptor subunit [Bacteroidales bacterium]|nr:efflux RND transporter periplasmic adaptor subunit [Bacteroidales bacterium]
MDNNIEKRNRRSTWVGLAVVIVLVATIIIVGQVLLRPEPETIMGEVSATEYRVSNKVPGRIDQIFVAEGDLVSEGDTLAYISSPEVDAKMEQAIAARAAATAQSRKAKHGARQQQIDAAYEMWQKALVGVDVAKKSFDRVHKLYEKKVISAQKHDEVEAQYKAALATANAAKTQYDLALEGAQAEDKAAADALVAKADGAIQEVTSYQQSRYLVAPSDGEVVEVYVKHSDLVGTGGPVLSIVDMSDVWFSFSVREDLLNDLRVGNEVEVCIPALGPQTYKGKVTYMRAMASYATWRATKVNGQYDVKSFDVKVVPSQPIEGLRQGMTAILK